MMTWPPRVGDVVTRYVGGLPMMDLEVTAISGLFVHCGDWTFDKKTGAEMDEGMGWGPLGTGSYLSVPGVTMQVKGEAT
mgnify:FL=1